MRNHISRSIKLILPLAAVLALGSCATDIHRQSEATAENGKNIHVTANGYNYYCQPGDPQEACKDFNKDYSSAMDQARENGASASELETLNAALLELLGFKYGMHDAITSVSICANVLQTNVCEKLTPPTTDQKSKEFQDWLVKALNDFAEKIEYYPTSDTPNTYDPDVPVENMIIQNIQNSLPIGGTCTLSYVGPGTYVCI
jgi:hypothetical protein